jgi:predicted anti-sigma-YlaC factor YlaD
MNCKTIREQLPDVALGLGPVPPDVEAHLASCQECAGTFEALKATMSLLDEWQAPEPSPYWDTRMQARLREEKQKAPASVWSWMRRPALSLAAALCLVVGVGTYQLSRLMQVPDAPSPIAANIPAPTGSAVADLQYLEKNNDVLQNFDALDALYGDDDASNN